MARSEGFRVPASQRRAYDALVRRANRQIQANLQYIQQEEIISDSTKRALLHDYADATAWNSPKAAISRSITFTDEKAFKAKVRFLEQFGGDDRTRTVESLKEGYKQAIIQGLTTVAIDNGGILTKQGRLPANLAKKIDELSLEQLQNWFAHADPTEQIEVNGWTSEEYIGADREEFIAITENHINALKQLYPTKAVKSIMRDYPEMPFKEVLKEHKKLAKPKKKKGRKKRKKRARKGSKRK